MVFGFACCLIRAERVLDEMAYDGIDIFLIGVRK